MLFFSFRDIKASTFLSPFPSASEATAVRTVAQVLKDGKSNFSQFPMDFELWFSGHFDEAKGLFLPADPRMIASLVAVGNMYPSEVDNG